jgi:hypothetical protein
MISHLAKASLHMAQRLKYIRNHYHGRFQGTSIPLSTEREAQLEQTFEQ